MTRSEIRPALVVRRFVRAEPSAVFAAWTDPEQLVRWWGPPDVECTHAEVDLRVGGIFRLANRLPDGRIVWITGEYQAIKAPERIEHTWYTEAVAPTEPEHVTIDFTAGNGGTEILIVHRHIPTAGERAGHEGGWIGCLDGLIILLEDSGLD